MKNLHFAIIPKEVSHLVIPESHKAVYRDMTLYRNSITGKYLVLYNYICNNLRCSNFTIYRAKKKL